MATFKYVAKNADSRKIEGKIVADNKAAVIEELRKRKLTLISVDEVKESGFKIGGGKPSGGKVKPEDIVMFSRQLATMVEAGIPILGGIDALQEQVANPTFKRVLFNVKEDIQHGSSLSAAFAKHTNVFDTLFINMVKVGETGGVLSAVLDRVSGYMEKTLKLQGKVKSAMIYPSVVVSMAAIITMVILVKVVPTFKGIYDSLGRELPAMTKGLIALSDILQHYILFVIVGIVVAVVVIIRWHKTESGGLILDQALLNMPVIGDLLKKVAISRFSRTLATLIQSGVPILESLEVVGKTIGNKVLEKVIDDVKHSVREGESIATPLTKSGVFPPMVVRMISIGEKSGSLEKMLLKISEFYDDQVDAAVEGLTSIIEPVIIGILGIVIGGIVIALFLPILNITQAL